MIKYSKILEKGFDFASIDLLPIEKQLLSLNLHKNKEAKLGKEVSYCHYNVSSKIRNHLVCELKKIVDPYLLSIVSEIKQFDAYKTTKEEYFEMHTDSSFGGLVQIMIYYIEEDLKGRELLYGTEKHINVIKPYTGLVVFCDQLNKTWLHGTNPLKTNHYNLCITTIV